MSPDEKRSHRIIELTRLVGRLAAQDKTPDEIILAVEKRALQMASPATAKSYVEEIKRRYSQ